MAARVNYFGCGELASRQMMNAVIGRRPEGPLFYLPGHELLVIGWADIPEGVRPVFRNSWDPSYRTYALREGGNGSVYGHLWNVTDAELELVGAWVLRRYGWLRTKKEDYEVTTENGNSVITVVTDAIEIPGIGNPVDGLRHQKFLNDRRKTLAVAAKVREKYLQSHPTVLPSAGAAL